MAMTGSEFKSYIASEVKKYEGVYVPLKASLLERAVKRSARTIDLHPNPDDEFSFPNIGPHDGIIAKYERRFRDTGKVKENPWDDSIMVQKIHPNGYMILNGHHRWAAALRADINRVPISIINLTHETDIKKMLSESKHDKRVTLDLDEVVFCDPDKTAAEKPLIFPINKIYKERIRQGIPSLLHILSKNGYDIWVYTKDYYSYDYISAYFKKYSVKLDGIITGVARKTKEKAEIGKKITDLFNARYKETLHIENNNVLRTFSNKKEFEDIEIKENENGWAYAVINIIKEMYPDESK